MPFGLLPYISALRAPRQKPNPMRKVDDMTVEGTEIIRFGLFGSTGLKEFSEI